MNSIILVALALVAVAVALPVEETPKIIRSDYNQNPDGSYSTAVETENGIKSQAEGILKEVLNEKNEPVKVLTVRGSYSYPGDDGKPVVIDYSADETGFHAEGESIPKPSRR